VSIGVLWPSSETIAGARPKYAYGFLHGPWISRHGLRTLCTEGIVLDDPRVLLQVENRDFVGVQIEQVGPSARGYDPSMEVPGRPPWTLPRHENVFMFAEANRLDVDFL
jgi:hypothetical protein